MKRNKNSLINIFERRNFQKQKAEKWKFCKKTLLDVDHTQIYFLIVVGLESKSMQLPKTLLKKCLINLKDKDS